MSLVSFTKEVFVNNNGDRIGYNLNYNNVDNQIRFQEFHDKKKKTVRFKEPLDSFELPYVQHLKTVKKNGKKKKGKKTTGKKTTGKKKSKKKTKPNSLFFY